MKGCIKGLIVIAMMFGVSAFGQDVAKKGDFGIRVSLGNAPGVEELEVDGAGTASLEDDGGGQLEILVVKRFWGANESTIGGVLGGGVFFTENRGKDGIDEVNLSAIGAMIQGGVAAKAGDILIFEITPFVGLGVAEQEITGMTDGRGGYVMYGIKGGAFVLLGSNVEIGLEVGYEGFANDVEFDFGGGATADGTFTGSGATVSAVLAVTF
ncbi:MAG: hypothetical protein K9M54_03800 [Kiritimatiellales bacterium]|nr:hypothetical protein [Kiritimatiellales bacterium]MCF7863416.1 hypothetical protein [Kiritimatiellales bacterium]